MQDHSSEDAGMVGLPTKVWAQLSGWTDEDLVSKANLSRKQARRRGQLD